MKAEERRESLLQAARSCFARKGFHPASMDDIAREAGVSPGLIYRYFASKVELVRALVQKAQDESRRNVAKALTRPDLLSGLEVLLAADLSAFDLSELAPLEAEIHAESFRDPEIRALLQGSVEAFREGMTALLSQAINRGELPPDPPAPDLADSLLAYSQGFSALRALEGRWDAFTHPETLNRFKMTFIRILGLSVDRRPAQKEDS